MKMNAEQIQKKIDELKAQKKEQLRKEKAKALREERKKNAELRKLESRVKYIIGGRVLSQYGDEIIQKILKDEKLREQDRQTLSKYLDSHKDKKQ